MANDGNGRNDTDPLLQHLISPRINPPSTLFPLPEHNDVDVVIRMLMTPSELKDRLVLGSYPPSVLIDALSQNPSPSFSATTSSSDYSTVRLVSTRHGFNRSRSAPAMAAINDPTHSVDHVLHRSKSDSKYIVSQAFALLIVYLLGMSVAMVGYGDRAFKTLPGRVIAAIWLLVSTLAVARAFFHFAEARLYKRNRELTNIVLGQKMSISQFFAADMDSNGYVSKSEYVIHKLKEMEKITSQDIEQIVDQFNKLDRTNRGTITLSDLLDTSSNHLSTATSP